MTNEKINKYRDSEEEHQHSFMVAFIVCLALLAIGFIYLCAFPAIDAGALAGR